MKRPGMRIRRRHQHYFNRIVGNPLKASLEVCVHCGMLRVVLVEPEGRDPLTIPGNTVCFDYQLKRSDRDGDVIYVCELTPIRGGAPGTFMVKGLVEDSPNSTEGA